MVVSLEAIAHRIGGLGVVGVQDKDAPGIDDDFAMLKRSLPKSRDYPLASLALSRTGEQLRFQPSGPAPRPVGSVMTSGTTGAP